MTALERLRQIVTALPSDDSAVTFTRAGLVALLDAGDDGAVSPEAGPDLTVEDAAHVSKPRAEPLGSAGRLHITSAACVTRCGGPTNLRSPGPFSPSEPPVTIMTRNLSSSPLMMLLAWPLADAPGSTSQAVYTSPNAVSGW